jgi:hypothetical protein
MRDKSAAKRIRRLSRAARIDEVNTSECYDRSSPSMLGQVFSVLFAIQVLLLIHVLHGILSLISKPRFVHVSYFHVGIFNVAVALAYGILLHRMIHSPLYTRKRMQTQTLVLQHRVVRGFALCAIVLTWHLVLIFR